MPNIDTQLQAAIALIVIDFILGVTVALIKGGFRFVFVGDFLRTDVLGKLVPWAALRFIGKLAPGFTLVGLDMDQLANAAWVALLLMVGASILGSLKQLGVTGLPDVIAAPDPNTPNPPPPDGQ